MEPELPRNHSLLTWMTFQPETILTSSTSAFISSGSTPSAKFFLGSDLDFFIIPCLYSFLCLYNYACNYRKPRMNFSANTSVLLITHTYWNLTPSLILPLSDSLTLLSLRLYSLTRIFHKYFKQISRIKLVLLILQTDPLPCISECQRYQHTPFYSFSPSLKLTLTSSIFKICQVYQLFVALCVSTSTKPLQALTEVKTHRGLK